MAGLLSLVISFGLSGFRLGCFGFCFDGSGFRDSLGGRLHWRYFVKNKVITHRTLRGGVTAKGVDRPAGCRPELL